jgi:asparagine synthase (glutamine-hydrolysing)
MCRIFGHFSTDASPHEMRLAAAAQRHGGPDAQSLAIGHGWSLGSNRLAIIDPEGGDQPYRLGDIHVVFNGEIYNHDELRADLRRRGYRFADRCDGSILPALYLEYGEQFARLLDGMFAVAVIDLRAEPKLVVATDDAGMKSLYYHWNPVKRHFYFASEIAGLLSFGAVDRSLWLPGVEEYLATKTPFGEQTMLSGVQVLPPAAIAVIDRQCGLRIVRRTLPVLDTVPGSAAEAADEVHQRFVGSIEALTRADAPVCAITSGGLDSSYVTAIASRFLPALDTFNIAYVGTWPGDERHFAAEVSERYGTRHHQVEVDPAALPGLIGDVVWHLGQPNADPITLSTYALFRSVKEAGFKVALTGDASDEFFGGYDRLRTAMNSTGDWIGDYVGALAAVPKQLRYGLYSDDYRGFLAGTTNHADRIADQLAADGRSRLRALSEIEVRDRLPAYHLRRVDHLSMAHSVEARIPFCQRSIVEIAGVLPDSYKIDGHRVKKVLYDAATAHLPSSVLNRPKQPFTLPITAMLHDGSALMTYARDMLAGDRLRGRGLFDPAAVTGLLARQNETPSDGSALAIWSLLIFEVWADQFGIGSAAPTATIPAQFAGVAS